MAKDQLRLYRALSRAPFPKSYVGKVFLTAFLGTHMPLLALLAYSLRRRRFASKRVLRVLSITVPATLGGTAFTLSAIYALSAPTALASKALRRYLEEGEVPELPVGYEDRAGRLMADVQHAVERLDRAIHSLEDMAAKDHLTGTYNRRAAEERLIEDTRRAQRGGETLYLALLDLDHLKVINDAYGHRAGDACLTHFSEIMDRNLRAGDWVARWGGDEFVVGMWVTPQEGQPTARVLDRVSEGLGENPVILSDGTEVSLTFSGGACRWRADEDIHALLSRADEGLYQAKARGRGKVVYID